MKTKWKKSPSQYLALILATIMVLSFTSCGKDKTEETPPPTNEITTPATPEKPKEKSDFTAPNFSSQIKEGKLKNEDIVGWLQIPDTEINAAVVQSADNQFYQRKNEWKEYSWTGSYFVDYECDVSERNSLSKNTIIYGHNVHYDDNKNKERFSQLFRFTDIEFAKKHPYVYFSTTGSDTPPTVQDPAEPTGASQNPENEMVWQIFSIFYTTTDFNYIQVKKDPLSKDPEGEEITEAQLLNLANDAIQRSEYTYNVEVTGKDKILTLSTCSYKFGRRNDVRFVVMAKLLDQDTPLKNTVEVKENKTKKTVK